MIPRRLSRTLPLALAALLGCRAEPSEGELRALSRAALDGIDGGVAPVFVKVQAEGSGCPDGMWDVLYEPDGTVFTLVFYDYTVYLSPAVPVDTRSCVITATLRSPRGVSFAVTRLVSQLEAKLGAGMSGSYSVSYGFQGLGTAQPESRLREYPGPLNVGLATLDEPLAQGELLTWSDCETRRDLQIRTMIAAENSSPPGRGMFAMMFLDGTASPLDAGLDAAPPSSSLRVELALRRCADDGGLPTDSD